MDRTRRILKFIGQMFPPFPAQLATFASFVVHYLVLARVFLARAPDAAEVLVGGASILLFTLQLRACDELKDFATDRMNFPDRPLVTGLVRAGDLYALLAASASLLTAAHVALFASRPGVLAMFAVVMAYSFLMWRWFFAERWIRPSLPLALATHHPIVFLFQLYTLSYFAPSVGTILAMPPRAYAYLLGTALAATAWELARKIRGTSEEDAYTTYSKLWGARGAVAAFCAALLASVALTFASLPSGAVPGAAKALWLLPAAFAALILGRAARFAMSPGRAPPFRKLAETYFTLLLLAALATALLTRVEHGSAG